MTDKSIGVAIIGVKTTNPNAVRAILNGDFFKASKVHPTMKFVLH